MVNTSRIRRPVRPIPIVVLVAFCCAGVRGDDAEGYHLLDAMPRERRAALAESLARFDGLDDRERATVRRLDRDLARRDPIDRARYLAAIRRYHAWLGGLSEEQRGALKAAESPDDRIAMVRQIRQKAMVADPAGPRIGGVRLGDLGLIAPHEMAFILQVWNKLPDNKRKAFAPLRGKELLAAIRGEAGRAKVALHPFPPEWDRIYQPQVEADPILKGVAGANLKQSEKAAKRADHPYAEFLAFEDPAHRPQPVPADPFARFLASCPPWLLAMTDPLNPDDARAYLTILYRLLYPFPGEMPASASAKLAEPPPAPKPAPKPQGGAPSPL